MVRFPTLVAAAFAVCVTGAAYAAPSTNEMAADLGQTLTLSSAKKMVSDKLAAAGQRSVQPGHAEFDSDGNVHVDIVNQVGLTIGHMIVHANDGMVTDANSSKKGARG
jgi:predicted phage tail protein